MVKDSESVTNQTKFVVNKKQRQFMKEQKEHGFMNKNCQYDSGK